MKTYQLADAQVAMAFMVNQASYIESEVYRVQYPEIQYPQLVPIDESAPEWAKSVTFYSIDRVGQAGWFHHNATDMRLADVSRAQFEQGIEMAGIGYRYTLEEIGQAMMLNWSLTTERAAAAVRAAEEFTEQVALIGDIAKGWTGILNASNVGATTAQAGVSTTTPWTTKTSDEIIRDINNALSDIYSTSLTVEMANTILIPVDQYNLLATKRLSDYQEMSVMEWLSKYNVYTAQTGQQLTIRAVRQLDGAGTTPLSSDRMVVYRRDPSVLKMHIPMRHRFLPVWQTGPLVFDIPGIFRLGGAEVRRPGAMRYVDGI